jgi:hypothetical protein
MSAKRIGGDQWLERGVSGLIESTEGLRGEPLLTQWLAYLLRHTGYQNALVAVLASVL